MPPSQLKRLKASLREQGLTGPQKSKKQRKQERGTNGADSRLKRHAALQHIRDSFNPFEIQAPSRHPKFSSASTNSGKTAVARPGVTKSAGEATRRQNLLPELQNRNKTGGILDKRIGEDDASMTPEEKALQRFIREKQRRKNGSAFDLEGDDDDGQTGLTHLGKALDFDGDMGKDDFDEAGLSASDDESVEGNGFLKRRRPVDDNENEAASEGSGDGEGPAKKKSKQEVMKEVIAKSKLHKYERQKAKEDDDDLRAKLDADLGDILQLLRGHKPEKPKEVAKAEPTMNADRQAILEGRSREAADKEYDARLRQMASDQRAAPTERSKTEEEMAKDSAAKLRELEVARQRRMQGDVSDESGDEKDVAGATKAEADLIFQEEERNDAAEFGFNASNRRPRVPVLDDEDEFELDDDLVASSSEAESTGGGDDIDSDDGEPITNGHTYDDEEDEFVKGILDEHHNKPASDFTQAGKVAYTYTCPRSHDELLSIIAKISEADLPTVIQRIRALYHPSLSAENKEKLADFAEALVDHLAYMGKHKAAMQVVEQVIRHLHSLSRTYSERIGNAFRKWLSALQVRFEPDAGDLLIFTAIGSIYPTSDHFHQVVTPTIILMARWLGLANPTTEAHFRKGACLVALCLRYQRISKRYIPEALRFTLKSLQSSPRPSNEVTQLHISNLTTMAEQYRHLSAFTEIFTPSALSVLQSTPGGKKATQHLQILLSQARQARRPLALHHHRPRAIRTSIPKFEENFAPGKHYDPDRERTEAAKLRKEYKREKKGAVRELRKDANFIAREQLRRQKEADVAYETKFRRLVAQINSEEGAAGNEYERVREKRKRSKK